MSDITSTIRINDGFSEPLQNLTEQALQSSTVISKLSNAIVKLTGSLTEMDAETAADIASYKAMDDLFDAITKRITKYTDRINDYLNLLKKNLGQRITDASLSMKIMVAQGKRYLSDLILTSKIRFAQFKKWSAQSLSDTILTGKIRLAQFQNWGLRTFKDLSLTGQIRFAQLQKYIKTTANDVRLSSQIRLAQAKSFVSGEIQYHRISPIQDRVMQRAKDMALSSKIKLAHEFNRMNAYGSSFYINDKLSKIFENLDKRTENLNEIFSSLKTRFPRVVSSLEFIKAQFGALSANFQVLVTKVGNLVQDVSTIASGSLGGIYNNIKGKVVSGAGAAARNVGRFWGITKEKLNLMDPETRQNFIDNTKQFAQDFILSSKINFATFRDKIDPLGTRSDKIKAIFNEIKQSGIQKYQIMKSNGLSALLGGEFEYQRRLNSRYQLDRFGNVIMKAKRDKFGEIVLDKNGNAIMEKALKSAQELKMDRIESSRRATQRASDRIAERAKKESLLLASGEGPSFRTEITKIGKEFALDFGRMMVISFVTNWALRGAKKLKESLLNIWDETRNVIQGHIDDIAISEKMKIQYGKNGLDAMAHAYALANDLGEDKSMVTSLAANAAQNGIGTKSFERMMRLSDKIATSRVGATTGDVAQELMQAFQTLDAESLASIIGGTESNVILSKLQERNFDKAFDSKYSTARNIASGLAESGIMNKIGFKQSTIEGIVNKYDKRDYSEVLDIVEKIAEEAGFTDEKYKEATLTMSQNYQKIENVVSNIKAHLGEVYSQALAPAIDKLRKFVESDKFKFIVSCVEKIVGLIGEFVGGLMERLIDNIEWIAILMGVAFVGKMYLMIRNVSNLLKLASMFKGILSWILKNLGMNGILGAINAIGKGQIKAWAKAQNWKKLGVQVGFLSAALVAMGPLWEWSLDKCNELTGQHKTMTEHIIASFAVIYQIGINLFTKLFEYIEIGWKYVVWFFAGACKGLGIIFSNLAASIVETWDKSIDYLIEKWNVFAKMMKLPSVDEVVDRVNNYTFDEFGKALDFVAPGLYDTTKAVMNAVSPGSGEQAGKLKVLSTTTGMELMNPKELSGHSELINELRNTDTTGSYADEISHKIDELLDQRTDMFNKVEEVYKEPQLIVKELEQLFGTTFDLLGWIADSGKKTGQNTGDLVRMGEREEDLRWLKQFSDRQIMTGYGQMTSNSRVINVNGMSKDGVMEVYRRDRATLPSKARALR